MNTSQYVYYRIYPKYSDTSTPYHVCSKIWTSTIHYPMLCLKIAGWVANSVDPDETPRSAASHLGLYCLVRPVCPNTYGKYGKLFSIQIFTFMIRQRETTPTLILHFYMSSSQWEMVLASIPLGSSSPYPPFILISRSASVPYQN